MRIEFKSNFLINHIIIRQFIYFILPLTRMVLSVQRTRFLNITIVIDWLYAGMLFFLAGFSLLISAMQYYKYHILNYPIDPFDPPLIFLGVILFFIYIIPALIISWITIYTMKLKNRGRLANLILLPFAVWLIFPFSIILVIFQFYTLKHHQETLELFQVNTGSVDRTNSF